MSLVVLLLLVVVVGGVGGAQCWSSAEGVGRIIEMGGKTRWKIAAYSLPLSKPSWRQAASSAKAIVN